MLLGRTAILAAKARAATTGAAHATPPATPDTFDRQVSTG
jgi:hypothetical protein